jgi:heat shock protein HslJ
VRHLISSLVLVALVAACASVAPVVPDDLPPSDEKRGLAGHRYRAESVVVDGLAVQLLPGRFGEGGLEIGFGLGHIYAFGCNEFTSGAWEVSEGRLVTGIEWTATRRGCDERQNTQDQWLYEFLISSPLVSRDGDELVLSTESTAITLRDQAGLNRPFRFF